MGHVYWQTCIFLNPFDEEMSNIFDSNTLIIIPHLYVQSKLTFGCLNYWWVIIGVTVSECGVCVSITGCRLKLINCMLWVCNLWPQLRMSYCKCHLTWSCCVSGVIASVTMYFEGLVSEISSHLYLHLNCGVVLKRLIIRWMLRCSWHSSACLN